MVWTHPFIMNNSNNNNHAHIHLLHPCNHTRTHTPTHPFRNRMTNHHPTLERASSTTTATTRTILTLTTTLPPSHPTTRARAHPAAAARARAPLLMTALTKTAPGCSPVTVDMLPTVVSHRKRQHSTPPPTHPLSLRCHLSRKRKLRTTLERQLSPTVLPLPPARHDQ